jgi:hypothetical protein
VPKSIQEEMRRRGQRVRTQVPPGPDNSLGQYWIGLNLAGYGIHGTIAPASLHRFRSPGCVHPYPDDIADLFVPVAIAEGIGPLLDWQRVEEVISLKEDVAREVSRRPRCALD